MKGIMKAWFLTEPGKMELRRVPIPQIGPRDILFRVSYASICGGDLTAVKRGTYIRHYPITGGHEFTGHVVEAGREVQDIPVGLRFMGINFQYCGRCSACRAGARIACEAIARSWFGFGVNGVFAEYGVLHNAIRNVSVFPLSDRINDLEGTTCEPMSIGVAIANALQLNGGENVVIYGAGIIGQSVLQTIKARWPDCRVAVVNRSRLRLDLARESGADYLITPSADRPASDVLRELWGTSSYFSHYGPEHSEAVNADVAMDCSGSPDTVAECFRVVKNCGTVCLAAGYSDACRASIAPADLFLKNIRFVAGVGGDYSRTIQYMDSGQLRPTHLITHVFPLEQLPEALAASAQTRSCCKVCIKVDSTAPDYPYNKQT